MPVPTSVPSATFSYRSKIVDIDERKLPSRKPDVVGRLLCNDKPPTAVEKPILKSFSLAAESMSEVTSNCDESFRGPQDMQNLGPFLSNS
jgi:hypothetical protein